MKFKDFYRLEYPDDCVMESILVNKKTIYYNKDKFDRGDINLCFLMGHNGGSKQVGKRINKAIRPMKSDDDVLRVRETYSLSILLCPKDHMSLEDMKTDWDMAYHFFTGPGKKYYIGLSDVPEDATIEDCDKIVFPAMVDFVKFAMNYTKSHKQAEYYIAGEWFFIVPDFNPQMFKDYAVYIDGTSALSADIQSLVGDDLKVKRGRSLFKYLTERNAIAWRRYYKSDKRLEEFRKYFAKEDKTS